MGSRISAPSLKTLKEKGEKIVCVTAYDVLGATLADQAGVDVVLVGDSLGNVVLGYETTVPVTIDHILHHLAAVRRGVKEVLLVADLPFGTYNASVEQAVENSVALMKAGADAVKLEGDYPEAVAALLRAGIPVMGHVGFTPQSVHRFGGFRVQGRGEQAEEIKQVALALQGAGAFAIVLELIPSAAAQTITRELEIPTIGIGAGPHCDGEIQVFHDLLGLSEKQFKHAKAFANGREIFAQALRDYTQSVRDKSFPTEDNAF